LQVSERKNILVLQNELKQLSPDFGCLRDEFSILRSVAAEMRTLSDEVSSLKSHIAACLCEPVAQQLSTKFGELHKEVLALKTQIAGLPPPPVSSVPL
jgi:hypothetical protein